MGIGKGPAILLMKEALRRPFEGKLLTLGRQNVSISNYQVRKYAKLSRFPQMEAVRGDKQFERLEDIDFFSSLGFSEIDSLDYSNYEQATISFDLNSGDTPEHLHEAFDVIYDGGTIEHIFNVPNALKSIIWMLKPGGRLIHLTPASNYLEHSFFMFSPTFFYDYYKCNDFEINSLQIVQHSTSHDYKYRVYDYSPGCFAGTSIGSGGLDNQMYVVHAIVTKTQNSTSNRVPNQSMYAQDMWNKAPAKAASSRMNKWKQKLKNSPLYPMYAACRLKLRRHGVPLPIADEF